LLPKNAVWSLCCFSEEARFRCKQQAEQLRYLGLTGSSRSRGCWQQRARSGMGRNRAGTGSHALGMSCVSPKGAGEDVEHPMPASPDCWWQGPCISGDPERAKAPGDLCLLSSVAEIPELLIICLLAVLHPPPLVSLKPTYAPTPTEHQRDATAMSPLLLSLVQV